jgi:hypothetical protein
MSNYAVKDGENSVKERLPEVYLISHCIPSPRTPFWYLMEKETEWLLSTTILQTEHEVRKYVASIGAVKWMRCEPPYARPPTPTASDDVATIINQWKAHWMQKHGGEEPEQITLAMMMDYIKWHANNNPLTSKR